MPHTFEAANTSSHSNVSLKKNRTTSSSSIQSYTRVLSPTSGTPDGGAKFPRIDECAHFHYETVECGKVELTLLDEPPDGARINWNGDFGKQHSVYWVKVGCKSKEWVIRRRAPQFKKLDELLHECVYDRRFTQLASLNSIEDLEDPKAQHILLQKYVSRLSELPEGQMSCAPVLHWFDMDNKGRNLVAALHEVADINIPAVAAAHAIRRYTARSADELSLEVGDMVSIIDMTDSKWWRGKCLLRVGSFPAQCVRRINDAKQADEVSVASNHPSSPTSSSPPNHSNVPRAKPIMKKHGKFMEFLRSFLVTRPSKSRLKQSGILKERVFGCDLGEYLHNCGDEVPVVVKDCMDFVEKHGVVDGIYRISGVSSHVQKLRHEYDCERRPNLNRDPSGRGEQSICDPHSVAGLCKLYFRELPNPLLTYQLYDRFAAAINAPEDDRLLKIHDVIQQLPPPHYRTLKLLAIHLQFMARQDEKTSMHCRNLAIVWAPNLLRSRDLEAGLAAFTEARVQSVVTEFLISNADLLFSEKLQHMQYDLAKGQRPPRPKSLMVLSAPKLISLEEAQARCKAGGVTKPSSNADDIRIADTDAVDVYRRKSSSPPSVGYKRHNSESSASPVAVIPLSTGVQSVLNKRRQSMDPKLGSSRPQQNFPSNSRHYASQHSGGWRSKIGSFLKKGGASGTSEDSRGSEKLARKVPLRRSQSDDSLLSAHSSRQDIDKLDESVATHTATELDQKSLSSRPPTLRQTSSPRSPRPRGRIFLVPEDKFPTFKDSDAPDEISPTKKADASQTAARRTPGTPESLATPSVETIPSSHSPFSGLDSDFPGVMGSTGLGFNPLQYSPTLSSPEPSIPDIPLDVYPVQKTKYDPMKNGNRVGSPPSRSVHNSTEDASPDTPPKCKTQEQNDNQSSMNGETHIDTNYEDILNANVKLPTPLMAKMSLTAGVDPKSAKQLMQPSHSSFHHTQVNNNSNKSPNETMQPRTTAKVELAESTAGVKKVLRSPGKVEKTKIQRSNLSGGRNSVAPADYPLTDYSVHYTAHRHESNGRMRQSITATFVQDRNRNADSRQPHSIVRSMDVPPTTDSSRKTHKRNSHHCHHHSMRNQFVRRHQAYVAIKSLRGRDDSPESKHLHCRSLSAGNELDFKRLAKRQPPVPLPRNPSNISAGRPVPLPRRRLYGAPSEFDSSPKSRPTGLNFKQGVISAPSTPTGGAYVPDTQFSSLNLEEFHQFTGKEHEENRAIDTTDRPQTESDNNPPLLCKKRQLSKANSASGIISPDNICESTPPSWV